MRSLAVLLCALATLAACATWPPGDDPRGKELKDQATPVLVALVHYRKDKGEYPSSLHELVPRYLTAVPFGPGLSLERDRVEFVYSPSWPRSGQVSCSALLGEVEWTCHDLS